MKLKAMHTSKIWIPSTLLMKTQLLINNVLCC